MSIQSNDIILYSHQQEEKVQHVLTARQQILHYGDETIAVNQSATLVGYTINFIM